MTDDQQQRAERRYLALLEEDPLIQKLAGEYAQQLEPMTPLARVCFLLRLVDSQVRALRDPLDWS